jgi:hypothetical protein
MNRSQHRDQGAHRDAAQADRDVVWAIVVWGRVVLGLILGAIGGVAFGHAWTNESAPMWWVGATSLLAGILVLLSGLYARSRPPGTVPDLVPREEPTDEKEPVVPLLGAVLLYKYQRISHRQLDEALAQQRKEGRKRRLGEILVKMDFLSPSHLEQALEYQRSVMREKERRAAAAAADANGEAAGGPLNP